MAYIFLRNTYFNKKKQIFAWKTPGGTTNSDILIDIIIFS